MIEHGTRRVRVLGATEHPVQAWVVQQARNLLMDVEDAGTRVKFVREYEDFYNTHRPHRTLNKPLRCTRCRTASPTWTISGSSGVTAPEA